LISFAPTEEQEIARDAMREFARDVIRPVARDCDETARADDDLLEQFWQLGLTSTMIPADWGGAGEENSPVMNALIMEELAHGDATLAMAALAPSLFVKPIVEQGTDAQKKKYLPAFTGDEFHGASLAWIEPGPVFDPRKLETEAMRRKDAWVLTGEKRFVPLADRASHFLVVARHGEEPTRLGAFIVERKASGLTVEEAAERNLGLRALGAHALRLQSVEVPAADRLGGDAGIDTERLLNLTRTALGAVMTGLARAVYDYALPYAKDRVAFGQPIAQKQAIAFMLSDMRMETDAMRLLVWKAASELERGADATRASLFARSYAAEQCMKIADNGVQVLGGHGFIRDHPAEMWYRNARTLGVLEGAAMI
jgi:alkylation response protein AidB-like acyl-CoA dehydrogenase